MPGTLLLLLGHLYALPDYPESQHKDVLKLMGSRFEITSVSADTHLAKTALNSAIAENIQIYLISPPFPCGE